MIDQEKRAREKVRRVLKGLKRSLSKDGNKQFFREQMRSQTTEWLVAAAREGHSGAVDLLRERTREARDKGEPVSTDLHEFVWELFLDGTPAKSPGPKPEDYLLRNMVITGLVAVVRDEFGFDAMRNKATKNKGSNTCACAIVAEELCNLGLGVPLDEGGVEKIWEKGQIYRAPMNSSDKLGT
jgi:hypothetical protein